MIRSLSLVFLATVVSTAALAQVPAPIAALGNSVFVQFHAEGAQVYECKADAAGKLGWQFREPIATLRIPRLPAKRRHPYGKRQRFGLGLGSSWYVEYRCVC